MLIMYKYSIEIIAILR